MLSSAPDSARAAAFSSQAATQLHLPTACEWDYMAREECMLGYGPVNAELRRRTAVYVAQILLGIPAGDLSIEGPANFELVVNLRTARSLGAELPSSIVAQVDEVIE